jgi:hypothetical protein
MRNLNRRPELPASLAATAALAGLMTEYDSLRAQGVGIQRAIDGLRRERREAAEKDKEAGALALRNDKPDPGDKASKAVEERAATLERRFGHVSTAQRNVLADVERQLEANGADWAADATAQAERARRDVATAFEAYRAAWDRLAVLQGAARWLRTAGAAKPAPHLPAVPGLKAANGEVYSLATVLDALAWLGGEPATEPVDQLEEAVA